MDESRAVRLVSRTIGKHEMLKKSCVLSPGITAGMHKAHNYCSERNENQQMCCTVWIDISVVYHWLDISVVEELQSGFQCSKELVHFTRRFSCDLSSLHLRLCLCYGYKNSQEG